jgi:hypothetical protein
MPDASPLGSNCPTVDVFVVDTARPSGFSFRSHRATAESTHVLCRLQHESSGQFFDRVLRRIQRITQSGKVGALWYIVGNDIESNDGMRNDGMRNDRMRNDGLGERCSMPLLHSLLGLLESGSTLTVVGPGTHQRAVFEWLEALLGRNRKEVTVRARLYPHVEHPGTVCCRRAGEARPT